MMKVKDKISEPFSGPWQAFSLADIFEYLHSSEQGLSQEEAEKRLKIWNLKNKKRLQSRWMLDLRLLLAQFISPLPLLLLIAVILSLILGQKSGGIIILIILSVSGLLSFWQERNAGKAVEKLHTLIRIKIKVLREAKIVELHREDIVPGDILLISAGDIIPADAVLYEAKDLYLNEAVLTGETYPSEKYIENAVEPDTEKTQHFGTEKNTIFQGSSVLSGTGRALVIRIGSDTVFGKIPANIETKNSETSFEKGLRNFEYLLIKTTILLAISVLLIHIYFGKDFMNTLFFALALLVGMMPELLPAILTVAMSVGAKQLAKEKVIVKKLSALENLGEINILCSDKTGTLTQGVISVANIVDSMGHKSDWVKLLAYLNAKFESSFSNPIDDALRGLENISIDNYQKLDEIPYDFTRKRSTILLKTEAKPMLICKGALENILAISNRIEINDPNAQTVRVMLPLTDQMDNIQKLYQQYSAEGFRTIGICYKESTAHFSVKEDEKDMIFAGFVLFYDPPKVGIIQMLENLKQQNVAFKMITGDNKWVAHYISKQIGIQNGRLLTGSQLSKMSSETLNNQAPLTDIFAEIEPTQKERIIQALQKSGNSVAYIGDGINDVAAIFAADVGISVDNAVAVAKEAADLVLLEKDLHVLADGILQGRKTFTNILKYIFINTSATFGSLLSVAGASIFLPFLPMLPEQLLLINFLTDFSFLFIASDEVDKDALSYPQKWNLRIIQNFVLLFGLHGAFFNSLLIYLFYRLTENGQEITLFRTALFISLMFMQLLIVFVMRTRRSFFLSKPSKWLLKTSIILGIITLILPYFPFLSIWLGFQTIPFSWIILIFFLTIVYAFTAELLKKWFFK